MITSVVGEYHWLPTYIGSLFIDDLDHYGLEYWYDIVAKTNKEIETINTVK
jgi:hypothetical protein